MAAQGIAQSAARNEPHATTIESDWEYEYDENETEDIYFTLDLTTHVPNAIQEKQYAKNGKLIGAAATASENAPGGDANGHVALDEEENPTNENVLEIPAIAEAGKLQILDLHTEKPYVKFNNGFYSCHWFTDLGTQFWITNPGVVNDPKFSGHVLDVVGSSQTRLVAKPANLKRKRDTPEPEPTRGQAAAQSVEVNDDAASDVSDTDSRFQHFDATQQDPSKPMVIPRQKIKDPHLQAQAMFMERLSAIKLTKGEIDAHSIPLKVPVYYKGAHNADALRAAHRAHVDEPQPTEDLASPAPPPDAVEGAAPTDEASPAPTPALRKPARRGRPGGGAISHAARRSNLGLDITDAASQPKKKRGRPSNAEKALRAQVLAAENASFALDPALAGPTSQSQTQSQAQIPPVTTAGAEAEAEAEADTASVSARSASREASAAASFVQGQDQSTGQDQDQDQDKRPRKRRRTKAQMEEARRLDEERQAKLAAARARKVMARRREEDDQTMAGLGNRSARRTRSSGVGANASAAEGASGDGTAKKDGQGGEGEPMDPQLEGADTD